MSRTLTSDQLIESVKRRASIPTSQNTFTDEDFLDLANEELAIGLIPSVLTYHEEYFVRDEDIPIEDNKSRYQLPYRAIGNKLRELAFKDSNDNLYEMTRVLVDDIYDYQGNSTVSAGSLDKFVIKGSEIQLIPSVGSGANGSLRMTYYLRPNDLVPSKRVAKVKSIDRNNGVIQLDKLPDNFSSSMQVDFIQTKSPHRIRAFDIQVSNTSTSPAQITLSSADDVPENLVEGDRVAEAEETDIPNIPSDLHVVLAHRVAARCLEALGDSEGLQLANTKLQEMETKTGNVVDNRVEGAPIKVKNRHSPLREAKMNRKGYLR